MGLGPYIYLVWFGVVVLALVVSVIHLVRDRLEGLPPAMLSTLGAVASWALVSAYIGVYEIDGYARTMAFAISLTIGFAGIALFVISCAKLK